MIKPSDIPDEVVEAAAIAEYEAWRDRCELRNDTLEWDDIEEDHREEHRANARVVITAAIKAWPGVAWQTGGNGTERPLLPLPQTGDA